MTVDLAVKIHTPWPSLITSLRLGEGRNTGPLDAIVVATQVL